MTMEDPANDLTHVYSADRAEADRIARRRRYEDMVTPAEPQAAAEPKAIEQDRGAMDVIGSIAKDVGTGIVQAPIRSLVGGARDAVQSTINAVYEFGDAINKSTGLQKIWEAAGVPELDRMLGTSGIPTLPDVPDPDSVTGKALKGIVQFASGFIPVSNSLRAAQATSQLGRVAAPAVAGFITDLLAFEGDQGRLSDLIQSVPALKNPVTEYLSTKEGDSKVEGRVKNALEGLGLGYAAEGVMQGLRFMKARKAARAAVDAAGKQSPEQAAEAVMRMTHDELIPPVKADDIAKVLGDPNAPLIQKASSRMAKKAVTDAADTVDNVFTKMRSAQEAARNADPTDFLPKKTVDVGGVSLPLNKDGTVTLYHGTDDAAAEQIRKTGFLKSDQESAVYLTTDATGAGYGNAVVPVRVNPEKLKIDDSFPGGRTDFRIETGRTGRGVKVAIDTPTAEPKIYVNLARINSEDDVKSAIQALADSDAAGINAARGGEKQTFEAMQQLAESQSMTVADLLSRRGAPFRPGEALAARQLWVASGEKVVELAKKAGADGATQADLYAFRKAMSIHNAVQREVIAARTETARSLASWRIEVASDRERAKAISALLDQSGGVDLSVKIARQVAQLDSPAAVSAFLSKAEKATTMDVLQEYFVTGLLTSPKTQVVNFASNSATAIYAVPERLMASVFSGDVKAGEAVALMYGQMKGMRDGLRMFAKAWKTGQPTGTLKVELPRQNAISSEALNLEGWAGQAVDLLGTMQRLGARTLMATDEFFKSVAYRGEVQAQAYRRATAEGLSGEAFAARVFDLTANPDESIMLAASHFADLQTFTNELGKGGKSVQRLISEVPAFKFFVPFIRTPLNILKYSFERTPLAPLMANVRADIAAGGAREATAKAKIALGTGVMLAIADMVNEGIITGAGPGDPNIRNARLRQGIQNNSIRIGDNTYTYNRMDPLATNIGMAADIAEIIMQADQEDSEKLVFAGAVAFSRNMANKTWLQGFSDLIEAIHEPDRNMARVATGLLTSFIPMSGMVRNIANVTDPVRRETKTAVGDPGVDSKAQYMPDKIAEFVQQLTNEAKTKIPGMGAGLPPKRNLWGEPIDISSGLGKSFDFLSPVSVRPVEPEKIDREILDNRMSVNMPDRSIMGVRLTNEEYSRYVELAGSSAKEYLDKVVASPGWDDLSGGPDGMKSEIVKSIIHKTRSQAAAILRSEDDNLSERIIQRKRERAGALSR